MPRYSLPRRFVKRIYVVVVEQAPMNVYPIICGCFFYFHFAIGNRFIVTGVFNRFDPQNSNQDVSIDFSKAHH